MAELTFDDSAAEQAGKPSRAVTVWLVVLLLPLLVLGVMRLGGIDGNFVAVAALALTPYVAAYGLLVALVALAARRRVITVAALVLSLSLAALLVPRVLPDNDAVPPGQRVRVMTANLHLGGADAAVLVRLVRDARVDVLALQELTPDSLTALDAAGLATLLPYRVVRPRLAGTGGGVLAKVPLRQIILVEGTTFEQPAAVVDLSGQVDIEVLAVHACPPVDTDEHRVRWQRDLAALPRPDPTGRPRVLAGDFNASLDHRAFTAVVDRGYYDAAELVGEGMRPTWSRWPFGPPVTLDHVLVDRRVGVTEAAVYDLPGSDHNAVVTELALPR